ncbi:hypothetical protein Tco_0337575 [Tanacetum coccineum]
MTRPGVSGMTALKLIPLAKRRLKVSAVVDAKTGKDYNSGKDRSQRMSYQQRQKSKSLGPCVAKGQDEGVADNGSHMSLLLIIPIEGNQLGLSRINKPKPDEDVFHTENVDLPPCRLPDEIMQEDDSNSVAYTSNKEDVGTSVSKGQERSVAGNGSSSAKDDLLRLRIYEPTSTKDIFDTDNVDLLPCLLVDDKLKEDDSNSVAP